MLGLAKTCKKLKIPFFDYLGARLGIPGPKSPASQPSSDPHPADPARKFAPVTSLSPKSLILWRARRDFELPTPRFVVWCSIQLSYGRLGRQRRRRRAAKASRASNRFCSGGQEQISRASSRAAASEAPRPSRREAAARLRASSARAVRIAEIKFRERAAQTWPGAVLIYIDHTSLEDAEASVHGLRR